MRHVALTAIAVLCSSLSGFAAEPMAKIAIAEIWANCADGAKPLTDLEPELHVTLDTPEEIAKYSTLEAQKALYEKGRQSFVWKIEATLSSQVPQSKAPQTGFAVTGIGRKALPEVYRVITGDAKRRVRFTDQDEILVAFFSRAAVPGVVVENIEWKGNALRIDYTLVSHGSLAAMSRLALIPLATLEPGKYRVEVNRTNRTDHDEIGFPPIEPGVERGIVCESFDFAVSPSRD